MAFKTVSIYCIGTDHKIEESYLIMMVMYDLMLGDNVRGVDNHGGTAVSRVTNPNDDHHKVVYNGANLRPNSLGGDADTHLRNVADNAVKLVDSVAKSGSEPITVNLLGHSRGAASCLLIANMLQQKLGADATRCNLFLIDTVKFASSIPEAYTRGIGKNVNNVIHIAMEDNTMPLFDLYEIKPAAGTADGRIKNIRLPGTHGTATQCNLLAGEGDKLPDRPDNFLGTEEDRCKLWPIGGVALSTALDKFKEWGTPLSPAGEALAEPSWQLYYYHRIQKCNPITSRLRRLRLMNDSGKSAPDHKQGFVKAPGLLVKRTEALKLHKFGDNHHRFGPVFVNEEHFELAKEVHQDEERLFTAVHTVLTQSGKGYNLHQPLGSTRIDAISMLDRLFYTDYPFLHLLNDAGFHWDGDTVFDLIGKAQVTP